MCQEQVPVQEQARNTDNDGASAGQVIIMTNERSAPSHEEDIIVYSIFGKKMPYDLLTLIYASLVAFGGILGYVLKDSKPSIISGSIFATILLVGAYIEAKYKNHYLLIAASATLFGVMGFRAFNASKFFPGGLVALLSLFMLLRYSYFTYLRYQRRTRTQ